MGRSTFLLFSAFKFKMRRQKAAITVKRFTLKSMGRLRKCAHR